MQLGKYLAMVASASALAAGACIIADPLATLPVSAERRPTIVRDKVVPPISQVLGVFPSRDGFSIEVEVDPKQTIEWRLFVDYNPFTGTGQVGHGTEGPTDGGSRQVYLKNNDTNIVPEPGQCHVVEALVALRFAGLADKDNHSFDSRGGDSVVWFYSPTGDLRGCPVYDAGTDGAFFDVQPEVLVTGDGGLE